jgi:hypothetical protein
VAHSGRRKGLGRKFPLVEIPSPLSTSTALLAAVLKIDHAVASSKASIEVDICPMRTEDVENGSDYGLRNTKQRASGRTRARWL